jgi:zinc resistance-associated protein
MWKAVLAGVAALTIAGSSLGLAQQAPRDGERYRPTAEDLAALTDARIAALRAGLKLNAEQEKNWPAVDAAMRGLARQRADRVTANQADRDRAPRQSDAIERLRSGAAAMTTRAAALTRLADAAEPLYRSLDEGQKHRFGMLLRMGARPQGGPPHWQRRASLAR